MTEDSSRGPWKVVPKYFPSGKLNPDFPGYVPPKTSPVASRAHPTVKPSAPVVSSPVQHPVPRSDLSQSRNFAEPPYVALEPARPLSAFNDDPLFKTRDAAVI